MRIEIHGVNNTGDSELGNITIRTYSHIKMYSQYYTVPQIFINGEQSRVGLGTATPDAKLHVTAGVSSVYCNEGVSSWLVYISMMNSAGVGQYYWVIHLDQHVLFWILMFGVKQIVWHLVILNQKRY